MKKTFAVALMLFMAVCFAPGTGSAKSGNGQGGGSQKGTLDRDRDKIQDCSYQLVTDGAPLLAGYNRGKRLGPKDGSGPRRDGSRGATCLRT
ncbi:MAG: hypothetical protein EHM86_04770 [Desulfobulbaceae bacterium]|nr:MAG: hypothetical protein EHM86_04770 [Desulfobulbaceae bacterium]